MAIVPLTVDMLEFRLREEPGIDPQWFVPHIRDYLAYDADSCFALQDGGETIGMVTAVPYQTIGWLGWLYVAEKDRGRGLGEELMRRATGHLISRSMKSIVLEAVVEAVSLYKRVGFSEQFFTQHYKIHHDRFAPLDFAGVEVEPFRLKDLERLASFDQRFFHQNRRHVLGISAVNQHFEGWVARIGGEIAGYLFATEASHDRQVGPLVVDPAAADSAVLASALVSATFAAGEKPLHLRCPLIHPDRSQPLLTIGAGEVDYHTVRMFLGDLYPLESPGVLCLGCPGRG